MAWGGEPWGSAPFGGDASAPAGPGPVDLAASAHAVADSAADLTTPKEASADAKAQATATGTLASGPRPISGAGAARAEASAALSGGNGQPQVMVWRPLVVIGGVDFSLRLTGTISVECEEDAASVADLSILPSSGTLLPENWIGRSVTIDYADKQDDGSAINLRRLFTGVIDVPELDSETSVLKLRCTDDLQGKTMDTSRNVLDGMIGGWWSAAVSDENADNWVYAQDRLASVPASMELDRHGALRVTPWVPKSSPDFDLDDGAMMSAAFRFASRSQIVNRVDVEFDYRFPRLKKRVAEMGYSYPFSLDQIMIKGYSLLARDMVTQAINGTGWEVTAEPNYTPCPAAPQPPVNLGGGVFGAWAVTPDVAAALCFGFVAGVRLRFAQSVAHKWRIQVRNLASIEVLGEIKRTIGGALESGFDYSAWEAYRSPEPTPGVWEPSGPPEPEPVIADPIGFGEAYFDASTGDTDDAAAAAYAVETYIAQAQTMIDGSHRASGVHIEMPIAPLLGCHSTVAIDCRNGEARGKVRSVKHTLDMLSGRAVTEAEVAISTLKGVGFAHPHTTPEAPPAPVPAPQEDLPTADATSTWVGSASYSTPLTADKFGFFTNVSVLSADYSDSAPVYPDLFTLRAPVVDDASRDDIEFEILSSAEASISEDLFLPVVP